MSAAYPSAAAAVGAATRKNGHLIAGATALTPFDVMASREASEHAEDEQAIRAEAVSQWWAWCWEGANLDPERAFRRFLSATRLWRPELVMGMNIRQAAALFGQTPAAQSVVERALAEEMRSKGGYRSAHVPGQKGEAARAAMAHAQKGNHFRARAAKRNQGPA